MNLSEDETAEFLSFFDEEPNFEKDFQEEIINLRSRNIERILLMISGSSEGRRVGISTLLFHMHSLTLNLNF